MHSPLLNPKPSAITFFAAAGVASIRRRELGSLDVVDVHFLADPFWTPRLALFVPVARCLRNIRMGLDATKFLAMAAIVLGLILRVGLLGATFGAPALPTPVRRGRGGA